MPASTNIWFALGLISLMGASLVVFRASWKEQSPSRFPGLVLGGLLFVLAAARLILQVWYSLPSPWPERLVGFDLATMVISIPLMWAWALKATHPRNVPVSKTMAWEDQPGAHPEVLIQLQALEAMAEGVSIVDADMNMVLMNRSARELLDFPEKLFPPGSPFEAFIKTNAERGDYGEGDPKALVAERVALARRFEAHEFERERPDGTAILVRGTPLPGGGFVTTYQDITLRQRAEEKLLEHQRLMDAIFESIPHRLFVKDRERRFLMINSAVAANFQVGKEEFIGRSTDEVPHYTPEELEMFLAQDLEVLETGRTAEIPEFRSRDRNGNETVSRVIRVPWFNDDGEVAGLVGLREDITERVQAQEALGEQKRLLQTLFDTIPHRLFIKDRQHRFLMVNAAGAKNHGASPEEFIGRAVDDLPFFTDEEKTRFRSEEKQVLESRMPLEVEDYNSVNIHGKKTHSRVVLFPWFDDRGELEGIIGMREDITARVEAETEVKASHRFLETVINAIPHALWVKDLEDRFLMVNQALADIHSKTRETMAGTLTVLTPNLSKEDLAVFEDMDRELLATGAPVIRTDVPMTRRQGDVSWRDIVKAPLLNEAGEMIAIVGLSLDVSDRKAAKDQVQAAHRFLESVVNSIPHALWVKDREGRYLMVNQALADLRSSTREAMLGHRSGEIAGMETETIDLFVEMDREVAATLGTVDRNDLLIKRPDGQASWRHIVKSPMVDEAGALTAIVGISSDVTRRVEAESKSREQWQLLEAIINAMPHNVFAKDLEGRYLLVNQGMADFRDTTREALLGKKSEDLPGVLPEEVERIDEAHRRVISEKQFVEIPEIHLRSARGKQTWRRMIGLPLNDQAGNLTGVVGISEDITASRHAREELREQRQLLDAIINALPHIIYAKDLEGRFLVVNQGMADFRNTTRESIVGKIVKDLPEISPVELEALMDLDRRVLSENRLVENPAMPIHTAKGEPTWRRMMKLPLHDNEGNINAIVGVGEDITARRQSEEELRSSRQILKTAFDNIPLAIYLKDTDFRYRMVNKAGAEFYGIPEDSFIGLTIHDMPGVSAEEGEQVDRSDRRVLEENGPVQIANLQVAKPGGKPSVRNIIKVPIHDGQGTITGVLVLSSDITERTHLEEQLRHSQKMESIGQIAGGVAHDFNNLLTIVLTNLEILQRNMGTDHAWTPYVTRSTGAAERGAMLTQRMLAFSRKQPLNPKRTDLNELVEGLFELIRSSLGHTIAITMNFNGEAWPVHVDRHQLENAIINLAVNSRDAMPNGGRLTLETKNLIVNPALADAHGVESGEFVALTLGDTGEGMTPEVLSRAFDPFYSTKETGKGTGLGLSMVYGFLKQSGGFMQVESQPGAGTTARLFLPRAQARHGGQPEAIAATTEIKGLWEKILVVEDDPDVRQIVMELLSSMGYTPFEARDAEHALEVLKQEPAVALMFSELVLPGSMDGKSLANRVRVLRPSLPIVITSDDTDQLRTLSEAPLEGLVLLPKPFQPTELWRAIHRAFTSSK